MDHNNYRCESNKGTSNLPPHILENQELMNRASENNNYLTSSNITVHISQTNQSNQVHCPELQEQQKGAQYGKRNHSGSPSRGNIAQEGAAQQIQSEIRYNPNIKSKNPIDFKNLQEMKKQQQLMCPKHNKPVSMLCFHPNCKDLTRLICNSCLTANLHSSHIQNTIEFKDTQHLEERDFLPIEGIIKSKLEELKKSDDGSQETKTEDIQQKFEKVQSYVNMQFNQVFKDMMRDVNNSNTEYKIQLEKSKDLINQNFTAKEFIEGLYKYSKNQTPQSRSIFDLTLDQYAKNYSDGGKGEEDWNRMKQFKLEGHSRRELLPFHFKKFISSFLSKGRLTKFEEAKMKFKEAFSILSEAVVSLANSFFLFNVPTFPDSEMKSFNKGQKVLSLSKELPLPIFSQRPLDSQKNYTFQFSIEGINYRRCWGLLLIKEPFLHQSKYLCWPSPEKGIFCCFDGDCQNFENSLQPKGQLRLQETEFQVEINISKKKVEVKGLTSNFFYALDDLTILEESKTYYLGFSLQDCQLTFLKEDIQ